MTSLILVEQLSSIKSMKARALRLLSKREICGWSESEKAVFLSLQIRYRYCAALCEVNVISDVNIQYNMYSRLSRPTNEVL